MSCNSTYAPCFLSFSGKYRDVTKMPGRTIDKTFELGKRFEDVGPDGKHSTNIVTKVRKRGNRFFYYKILL